MKRFLLLWSLVIGHWSLPTSALASEPLTIGPDMDTALVGPYLHILENTEGVENVTDAITAWEAGRYRHMNVEHPIVEVPSCWLKFSLKNATGEDAVPILHTNKFFVADFMEVYVVRDSGRVDHHLFNGMAPFESREVRHRLPTFKITLQAGEACDVYIRPLPFSSYHLPLAIWSPSAFNEMDRTTSLVLGLYYGLVSVMVLYNLFLFVSLRDRTYLHYVVMVTVFGLYYTHVDGLAKAYLWPGPTPHWGLIYMPLFGCAWTAVYHFVQSFLQTALHVPRADRAFTVLKWSGIAIALWIFPFLPSTPFLFIPIYSGIGWLAILAVSIYILRLGYRPARFFVAAWSALCVGGIISNLGSAGVIPYTGPVFQALQIGHALEAVILSLALADRINVLRRAREEQEAAAREAERISRETREQSERKSAFLASMAHELRTPLNAIKGFNSLVLRRSGDVLPERQQDNLHKVDRASDHLLAMINDLLDLSKIEAGRMDVNVTTFDVRQTILSACDVVSPLVQEGVELRHDISDDIGEAHTDRQRLSQMLINLLSNAIKFTEAGSVCVRVSSLGAERSALSAGGEQLVIAVSDTGRGIPEHELPTLFDEYRQVEGQSESAVQSGTGLGLSITKRFAELLGGSISVESKVGVGSTFKLTIPLVYTEQEANA